MGKKKTSVDKPMEEEEENLEEFLILFDPNGRVNLSSLPSAASSLSAHEVQTRGAVSLQNLRRKRELELSQQPSPDSTVLSLNNSNAQQQVTNSGSTMDTTAKRARYSQEDSLVSSSSSNSQQQNQQQQRNLQESMEGKEKKESDVALTQSSSPITTAETSNSSTSVSALGLAAASGEDGGGGKKWTEKSVEQVLASQTDPIGKFLRDLGVSAADAIRLNVMPHLDQAPRKPRTGYGKRKDLPPGDRKALSRERNREHAKSTRQRRKVFEVVLDQQLRKLGHAICCSFTAEHTAQYLQRRNRRVENLVGFFLLMDSHISSHTHVSWQYCLSGDLAIWLQLQGLLTVQDENLQKSNQHSHSYESLSFLSPTGSISTVAGGVMTGRYSFKNCVEDSHCFSGNNHAYGHVSGSVGGSSSYFSCGDSGLPSQGTGGGTVPRLSLGMDLTPPQLPNSPSGAAAGAIAASAAAFFGLPLSLLHLPPSPSKLTLLPLPISSTYRGYQSLQVVMKRVLQALQQAVYHVLVTNSFYRKVFDLIVPKAPEVNTNSWPKSPSWQQTHLPVPPVVQNQGTALRTEAPSLSQACTHTPTGTAVCGVESRDDLPRTWACASSPSAPAPDVRQSSHSGALNTADASSSSCRNGDGMPVPIAKERNSSVCKDYSCSMILEGCNTSACTDKCEGLKQLASPSLSSGVVSKQLFFSSPNSAQASTDQTQQGISRHEPAVQSGQAPGTPLPRDHPVLMTGGLLCYPSSLNSSSHTQDSTNSNDDSDIDNASVINVGDNASGSDGDTLSAVKSMHVRGDPSSSLPSQHTTCHDLDNAALPPAMSTKAARPSSDLNPDPALASSVASECPGHKQYVPQHPPSFALEHLIPVGLKFLISFSKNDLLVQGMQAMCSFDLEVETKVPTGDGGEVTSPPHVDGDDGDADHDEENDVTEKNGHSSFSGQTALSDSSSHKKTKETNAKQASSIPTSSAPVASSYSTTLVNVPGAMASFSFESLDVMMGASKISDATFDLDINAAALSFLDHAQLLHEYFGSALRESRDVSGAVDTTVLGRCNSTDDGSDGAAAKLSNDGGNRMECEEVSTI